MKARNEKENRDIGLSVIRDSLKEDITLRLESSVSSDQINLSLGRQDALDFINVLQIATDTHKPQLGEGFIADTPKSPGKGYHTLFGVEIHTLSREELIAATIQGWTNYNRLLIGER